MSQQDNFSGGFLLGALVGGITGGVLGALLASRRWGEEPAEEPRLNSEQPAPKINKAKRRSLKSANGYSDIEAARRSLEDKIAQLNEAIDDVRQQLGGMEQELPGAESPRSIPREP